MDSLSRFRLMDCQGEVSKKQLIPRIASKDDGRFSIYLPQQCLADLLFSAYDELHCSIAVSTESVSTMQQTFVIAVCFEHLQAATSLVELLHVEPEALQA